MTTKELRIGNIIGWRDGLNGLVVGPVYEIHADKIAISPPISEGEYTGQGFILISGIEGIPITDEWLIKLGFKDGGSHDGGTHSWRHPDLGFAFDGSSFYYYDDSDCMYCASADYIHQLQNFFFACEGEELEVKL